MLFTELHKGQSITVDETKVVVNDNRHGKIRVSCDLEKDQSIVVAGATITVVENKRSKVKLSIDADKSINIKHRRKNESVEHSKQDA